MGTVYADYTIVDNYTPPANADIKYILFSAYNNDPVIGRADIQSVTITATPICFAPTLNNAVVLGGAQVQIQYTPPAFTAPITQYDVKMNRFDIIYSGPVPILVPTADNYTFTNVPASPTTVTVPKTGYYAISMQSVCPTGNVRSNSLSRTVN